MRNKQHGCGDQQEDALNSAGMRIAAYGNEGAYPAAGK